MASREVAEGRQHQGEDEIITYKIDITQWDSSPTTPQVVVKRVSDNANVTSTVMPTGSASVSGNIITLPAVRNLVNGETYRIEVKFTASGNTYETYFFILAEE
jgi:hypothetical protein